MGVNYVVDMIIKEFATVNLIMEANVVNKILPLLVNGFVNLTG